MRSQLSTLRLCGTAYAVGVLFFLSGSVRAKGQSYVATGGGHVTFSFDRAALDQHGLKFLPQGERSYDSSDSQSVSFSFFVQDSSDLQLELAGKDLSDIGGVINTCGALLLDRSGERVVVGNLQLVSSASSAWVVRNLISAQGAPTDLFFFWPDTVNYPGAGEELFVAGDLYVAEDSPFDLITSPRAPLLIGRVSVSLEIGQQPSRCAIRKRPIQNSFEAQTRSTQVIGPDVIVAELQSVIRIDRVGDLTSFAVGTTACNIGDQRAKWISGTNQHPVIVQNLHRLHNDRFEQIGMSWVKHGFYAVSQSLCSLCRDPTDGSELGVGCSDPYSASLNAVQSNMSPRYEVDGFTGDFPYPWQGPAATNRIERRLQAHDADLDPLFNAGARYFIEGHYVMADDAAAGTMENNASYREVELSNPEPGMYRLEINYDWNTQRAQPAVRAWQDVDPSVVEADIRVPGEGLFILAAKASPTGTGMYRYAYALQNLNSDRSARSFSIPIPNGAIVGNLSFHSPEYHSGEPYSPADWVVTVSDRSITWSTDTFETDPMANALRYDTVFSFYFETNAEPASTAVTLGLFKPGFPTEVVDVSIGPKLELIDCNRNERQDQCDVDCAAFGCDLPCGDSLDCNSNGIPDECEADCNGNGQADECDILACAEGELACSDCNANLVPDGCETDCDQNGIPDDCVAPADSDGDGVDDCRDLCPDANPNAQCACPPFGNCCWPVIAPNYCSGEGTMSSQDCLDASGEPDCLAAPCRLGCQLGDYDQDGDLDLRDFGAIQNCFSGWNSDGDFEPPSQECSIPLDFDGDDDIDLGDFATFEAHCNGPQ